MDLGWKIIYTGIVFLILGVIAGVCLIEVDDSRVQKAAGITAAAGLSIIIAGILLKIWM